MHARGAMLKRLETADPAIELAPLLEIAGRARKRLFRNAAERGGEDGAADVDDLRDRRGAAVKAGAGVDQEAVERDACDPPAVDQGAGVAREARRVGLRQKQG